LRVWTELGECVAASGVRKLVLLNSHGGQVGALDVVGRDLRSALLGMLVYSISWFNLPLTDAQGQDLNAAFSADEHRFGIHAGEVETSMMLALGRSVCAWTRRSICSTSQQRAERLRHCAGQWPQRQARLADAGLQPPGRGGRRRGATAELGQALLDAAGRALAQALVEIDQLPPDTLTEQTAFS
jgi:creatinine amidohydrolase